MRVFSEHRSAMLRIMERRREGDSVQPAREVCQAKGAREWLSLLCSRGLVRATGAPQKRRFNMLVTFRDYAEARLPSRMLQTLRRRHAAFFRGFAEAGRQCFLGNDEGVPPDLVLVDQDNLRAVLAWALEHDHTLALDLACALGWHWELRGQLAEGRKALTAALAHSEDCALRQGDRQSARTHYEKALVQLRQNGGPRGVAAALGALGNLDFSEGNLVTAARLQGEALKIGEELGDRLQIAVACEALGRIAHQRGELPSAHDHLARALTLMRELGIPRGIANALFYSAEVATAQGNHDDARVALEECLDLRRQFAPTVVSRTLELLGEAAEAQGEPAAAARFREEATALS